jgi:molybdenum cofactor biosynthesis enzyme MoaA
MKLQDIGFYTLSDERALNSTIKTPLHRCELVLTEACNFNCLYCRGLTGKAAGTIDRLEAEDWVEYWLEQGLKNVRFTGGEPLLWPGLVDLVQRCRNGGVERIAVSSNGSLPLSRYHELIAAGVNDLSISLDSGCCAGGEVMSGGAKRWDRVVENIKALSQDIYVSLGMVFTPDNVDECVDHVMFADSLNPGDIRVIPSAQYNKALEQLIQLPAEVLDKYPILRYRIENITAGLQVRGMQEYDCRRCWLAMDDMAVAQGHHFPCIIHLREGGEPIGKLYGCDVRADRLKWLLDHDSYADPICQKNCLDVCIAYNNKARETHGD